MPKNPVVVIGSGFSSLSAATFLADRGHRVIILEKNTSPGGRARKFEQDGFVFDMGPSWYWMPEVFDRYFELFGHKTSDLYNLKRLNPSYKVVFGHDRHWDIPASAEALGDFFETQEPGASIALKQFLKEAGHKYNVGIKELVFKPGRSLSEFIHPAFLKGIFKLDVFNSHSAHVRKFFKHPDIIKVLEFPVLFLGAKPSKTPALYSLMNYADISLGTWYPMGGMHKIVEAMVKIAQNKGVEFRYNHEVTGFEIKNQSISSVSAGDKNIPCSGVIGGADYQHLDQKVTPAAFRNYSSSYWDKRTLAPSSLIFYLGISKRVPGLLHHNLFFDEDFEQHAKQIYDKPSWPDKPLFYTCVPSVTDSSVAPQGCENIFILIPVAPDIADSEEMREKYYHIVMERLERYTGFPIRNNVVYKKSYAHRDFINDYNAFKGNAYGLANTLSQTAILKPSLKSKKIKNLYFTGQLTVPGPGVPPSIISGEVVAKEYIKDQETDKIAVK